MRAITGTWPQYSTPLATILMSSLSSFGMATNTNGAGPRHSTTRPSNSNAINPTRPVSATDGGAWRGRSLLLHIDRGCRAVRPAGPDVRDTDRVGVGTERLG